jgi:putative endonuclease
MRRSNLNREFNQFAVYIMTNFKNTTLYTGFTSKPLKERVWEHKQNSGSNFTKKYKIAKLVYFEVGDDFDSTLAREKQIKSGSRADKVKLIETINKDWRDLYDDLG